MAEGDAQAKAQELYETIRHWIKWQPGWQLSDPKWPDVIQGDPTRVDITKVMQRACCCPYSCDETEGQGDISTGGTRRSMACRSSGSSSVSIWALEQKAFAVEPLFEQQRKQLSMLFRVASQERDYFLRADVGVLGEQPLHQLLQSRFPCVVYGASPMAAAVCDTRRSMAISRPPPYRRVCVPPGYRSSLGFHSRASFCASATCAGVIFAAILSRVPTALSRSSFGALAAARSNHMYDCA